MWGRCRVQSLMVPEMGIIMVYILISFKASGSTITWLKGTRSQYHVLPSSREYFQFKFVAAAETYLVRQAVDIVLFLPKFKLPPFILRAVDIRIQENFGAGIFLLEFDRQMQVIILIDSKELIGNYGEGAAQETFFAYPHVPGLELGNLKGKERRFCIHDSDPGRKIRNYQELNF